jgi:hypothetical protein
MLEDSSNSKHFIYIKSEQFICDCCSHSSYYLIPVYYKGTKVNLCLNCIKIAKWCPRCGKAFFPEQLDDILCGECKSKYVE